MLGFDDALEPPPPPPLNLHALVCPPFLSSHQNMGLGWYLAAIGFARFRPYFRWLQVFAFVSKVIHFLICSSVLIYLPLVADTPL